MTYSPRRPRPPTPAEETDAAPRPGAVRHAHALEAPHALEAERHELARLLRRLDVGGGSRLVALAAAAAEDLARGADALGDVHARAQAVAAGHGRVQRRVEADAALAAAAEEHLFGLGGHFRAANGLLVS